MRERLYRLDRLCMPKTPGRARRATAEDGELILGWVDAFIAESGVDHAPPPSRTILARIEQQLAWLWLDEAGEPAAMALRNAPASGVARVGPVYTTPTRRRRGYGAAVTAACTADAIEAGVQSVVLFTDLANPTSNSIYQQIGYRPLSDRLVCEFLG
jgi:predicted GNAT family acetyltransferase